MSNFTTAEWREVSRSEECPVCHKPDWCTITGPEGNASAAYCMRVESNLPKAEGWIHKLRDDHPGEWRPPAKSRTTKPKATFTTANDAAKTVAKQFGRPADQRWTYHDSQGQAVGVVLRWNKPDGSKEIRPLARHADGWRIESMPTLRPLYHLPYLRAAELVAVCEGEKSADALRSLGMTATTSAGGSSAAKQSDWSPLAGKHVVILPDNDGPGRKYANDILQQLSKLNPAPIVKVVVLPDLPEAGDVVDWLAAGGTVEELQRLIVAGEAEEVVVDNRPTWKPMPIDGVFPAPLAEYIHAEARATVVDESMVAMPLLAALAGAIGGSRQVAIKYGWFEPCILWTATVAQSGSGKTPAAKNVLRAVRDRDAAAHKNNKAISAEHEADLAEYVKQRGKSGDKVELIRPERPPLVRYHLQDCTPEQLLAVLEDNPRGVLVVRDELSGLLGGFGRYSDGKGSTERAKYLSIWSAEQLADDRKMARSAYVRRPHVSIYGGVQPDLLFKCVSDDDTAAGLPARFLFAWPPDRSRRWTEATVDDRLLAGLSDVFDRLYALELVEQQLGDDVELAPVTMPFTRAARQEFALWHDDVHALLAESASGPLRAAYSKLPGYCGRLALVLQLAHFATGAEDTGKVEVENVRRAIELVEWFRNEAARVYALQGENAEDQERRRLVEFIQRKGGAVTVRDVQRGSLGYSTASDAETALNGLVAAGMGYWETEATATNKRRTFRLSSPMTMTDSRKSPVLGECVSVSDDDAPQTDHGETIEL